MNHNNPLKIEAVKLPIRVKLTYGAGSFAKTMLVYLTMVFMLYFYTDVIGISEGVAATIILIAKIWDIINDPMMGAIVDKTKSKEGKCRFWLKYFSVPAGVVVALCFMMPELSQTGKIVWVAVTYTLQGMASTVLLIPLNTLMGRLSGDKQQRAHLNQIAGFYGTAAGWIVPAATLPMVSFFGGDDMQKGFMVIGIIYGILYAICHLVVFFGTRGYEPLEFLDTSVPEEERKLETPGMGQVLRALLKNKVWLFCIGLYFFDMIGSSIESSAQTYYFQYNLGNTNLLAVNSTVATVTGILVYVVLSWFTKHFGNSGTAAIGCALPVIGYGLRFILQDANVGVMIAGWTFSTLGAGLVGATIVLNIFDAKVYGEWKTGVNNEAILMSGFSVSYKIGMALGAPIAGYMLMMVPYVPKAAQQAESVLRLFFFENTLLPCVGFIIALFFCFAIRKYEKMLPQMEAEIEARRHADKSIEQK